MDIISIKDRLPKNGKKVLLFAEFWTTIGERWNWGWLDELERPFEERSEWWDSNDITHWAELPTLENNK